MHMLLHTTDVVDSRPHSTHFLGKRALYLTEIVHYSNVRVLPTVREIICCYSPFAAVGYESGTIK